MIQGNKIRKQDYWNRREQEKKKTQGSKMNYFSIIKQTNMKTKDICEELYFFPMKMTRQ